MPKHKLRTFNSFSSFSPLSLSLSLSFSLSNMTTSTTFVMAKSAFPAACEELWSFPTSAAPRISWVSVGGRGRRSASVAAVVDKGAGEGKKGGGVSANSNYVVPLDKSFQSLTRPLAEILRDLNKRVPDKIIDAQNNSIPWYHANRMLSFYAPGWCGEVRDVIYSDNGSVTVVYRVTIRGSDGEAHRESTGTVSCNDEQFEDPVVSAEEIAFCRACARFGFGLYLYHEEEEIL